MKVGMVLPVYHQLESYIEECLNSIESQTFRNFKLVIVIDGANQQTVDDIYKMVPKLSIPYEIINRRKNKGIAFSLNEGFSKLKDCEYFTWVSSDNRYNSNFLQRLVDELDEEPKEVVVVYSMFNIIGKDGEYLSKKKVYRRNLLYQMNRNKNTIFQNNFIRASFLFRKDAFFKAGQYNTKYEKVEDYEFWIRLLQNGDIKFVPEVLMEYRLYGEYSYTTIIQGEEIQLKSAEASAENRKKLGDIPKVSVILKSNNAEKYIKQAIKSVLNQSYTNFHLIFIDNASSDQTWERANEIHDRRIIPIRLDEIRGPTEVLNIGLRYALGEYILEMDGNDWIEPNTIEVLFNEMEKQHENVAMAYGNQKIWYQKDKGLVEGPLKKGSNYHDKYHFLMDNNVPNSRFYRKSILIKVGGWPSAINGEPLIVYDYAMMLQLLNQYQIHWIDEILYNNRIFLNNKYINSRKKYQEQLKFVVYDTLEKWGGIYSPIFKEKNGWVKSITLEDKIESKQKIEDEKEKLEKRLSKQEKENAKVTVLIPSYNAREYLKEAVISVLLQSYPNWKLIIIDDGSTDNSIDLIKEELKDPRVEIIHNEENLGQAKSLNIGLSKVNTPYLIQLDADDWFEANTLEIMVNRMESLQEEFAVLHGNMLIVVENEAGNKVSKRVRKGKEFKSRYEFLLYNASVWPRFYRTSALRDVGGWPTDGPFEGRYIEDLRILFRLIEKYRFYWLDEVLYNHRRHRTNQTKDRYQMIITLDWLIRSTLKRWGNKYRPVFTTTKEGYRIVKTLSPVKKSIAPNNHVPKEKPIDKGGKKKNNQQWVRQRGKVRKTFKQPTNYDKINSPQIKHKSPMKKKQVNNDYSKVLLLNKMLNPKNRNVNRKRKK